MGTGVKLLRKLTKKQCEKIKDLTMIGVVVMLESEVGLDNEQEEALGNLISMCGGAEIDDRGNCTYEYNFDETYLDIYNEKIFWNELARRLAIRDTLKVLGENIKDSDIERYKRIHEEYMDKYLKEFKKDGYPNKLLSYKRDLLLY